MMADNVCDKIVNEFLNSIIQRKRSIFLTAEVLNVPQIRQSWSKPYFEVQSNPGYRNTFGQRGFIGCSDKRNCSDNPNETFLAIYILYSIKLCMKVAPEGLYTSHCTR